MPPAKAESQAEASAFKMAEDVWLSQLHILTKRDSAHEHADEIPDPVAHPNGAVVPVDPADVLAAREEHLAAHPACC